ncbi:GntR family transcriptional regulator [Jatrophihabitans sp. YIM 134969]
MLEHLSLPEVARRNLRRRILNDELPAGARLVETTLAQELGVSRATIREAMRQLAAEGLIEIHPRRQSVVTRMSADDARDVLYARYVLETGAARRIRAGARPALGAAMKDALQAMDKAAADDDVESLVEADIAFHRSILEASGARRVHDLWETINGQMGALMRSAIDRQQLALGSIRALHEPLQHALLAGSARTVEKCLADHYLDTDAGVHHKDDGR